MSLPIIKTVADAADYYSTVKPYIPQLYELPYQIWDAIRTNPASLKQIYVDTNPLLSGFALSLFFAPIFLVVSEANRNYSQVDRCWSLLPTLYNLHFTVWAHLTGLPTKRLDTLLAASVIWSIRLTFNYWRKGGYSIGSEDYRWEIIQKKINRPLFFLLNVSFISFGQSVLLFLVASPTYVLLLTSRLSSTGQVPDFDWADTIFSRAMVALVLITAVADQQQWDFQTTKYKYKETAKIPSGTKYSQTDLDRGFLTKGLWAWSRHPNFTAEQLVWVTLYSWAAYRSENYLNWTLVGTISYLLVFQGSTPITERISAGKYPEYKEYQKRVGMFLPTNIKPVDSAELDKAADRKAIADGSAGADGQKQADHDEARKRYDLR